MFIFLVHSSPLERNWHNTTLIKLKLIIPATCPAKKHSHGKSFPICETVCILNEYCLMKELHISVQ
jgi:hypothetical protein